MGRRDEVPNQELAQEIIQANDKEAIKELVSNLKNKDKNVQSDCIKVLYEIGATHPGLIAEHDDAFIDLLASKNNRLVWGAMTAIDAICQLRPDAIYTNLSLILDVADKGSVITKDHAVNILITLASHQKYADNALALLLDFLKSCAANQLPMYAENTLPVVTPKFKNNFIDILNLRLEDMDKESKRKRVEKVIKRL